MNSIINASRRIERFSLQFPHGISVELVDHRNGVTPEDGLRNLSKRVGNDPSELSDQSERPEHTVTDHRWNVWTLIAHLSNATEIGRALGV